MIPAHTRADRSRVLTEPRLSALARARTAPIAVLGWLAACWVAIITSTPYLADDGLNKDLRATAVASGDSLLDLIVRYTGQWMMNEGRFFPGSLTWSYSLFWFTGSVLEYKLVLGIVLVTCIAVLCLLVARSTGRWRAAGVFGILSLGCLQLRLTNDGTAAYGGLLPLTAGLTAAAVLILVSRPGWGWAVLAGALFGCALVTYETVILFTPAMVAVVVIARRSWRPAAAVVVPALLQLAVVLVLRGGLDREPAPGYTIDLAPGSVLTTLGKQMLSAVPLSQFLLADGTVPPFAATPVILALIVVGFPALIGLRSLSHSPLVVRTRTIVLLAAVGLWVWGASSALVAVTDRWQTELRTGQGYIPVVYGYFGLAMCLLAGWLALERAAVRSGEGARCIWAWAGSIAAALLVTVTFAGNVIVAGAL